MSEQNSTLRTEYGEEVKQEGLFLKIASEDRRKVLDSLEKYISTEGMGCVVCPCYTSCTRC